MTPQPGGPASGPGPQLEAQASWLSLVWVRSADPAAATQLARLEVASRCGTDVQNVVLRHLCPRCGSDAHGSLSVVPWSADRPPWVSLSRSSGLVLVGVSSQYPVGVDVEREDAFVDSTVADVLLHPEETAVTSRELARTWVRKESVLKATGQGLGLDPRALRLSAPGEQPAVLEWADDAGTPEQLWMRDLALVAGSAAAVTVLGPAPDEISLRQAGQGELPR